MSGHTPVPSCPEKVRRGDTWHAYWEPCGRKAKANGYCGIHDPAKREAKQRKWDERVKRERADAQLRSAAPALFEALRECADQLGRVCGENASAVVQARAALAAAEGKP